MRFLADMGISPVVVQLLREAGHDVLSLPEHGLQRLADRELFQLAAQEQRIVLTVDLEFGEIVAASGGRTVSVILFRLQNMRADAVWRRLTTVLDDAAEALVEGAIVAVEEARHRIRRLPIGE